MVNAMLFVFYHNFLKDNQPVWHLKVLYFLSEQLSVNKVSKKQRNAIKIYYHRQILNEGTSATRPMLD